MIRIATLGDTILIARPEGDRPAIITKAYNATSVEACAFAPMPEHLKVVTIKVDRREAIQAGLEKPGMHFGYWKPKA